MDTKQMSALTDNTILCFYGIYCEEFWAAGFIDPIESDIDIKEFICWLRNKPPWEPMESCERDMILLFRSMLAKEPS